ncbi:MAG: protein-export chaperone SecB [Halieaceae bacterium]|jgi:preprotein translocase subunit SecB|nr:protein-export chaperone SecB [Halieaceae bacterium]
MADEQQNGAEAAGAAAEGQPQQEFVLQRVYLKDLSYESPGAPNVFRKEYRPAVNVDLRTQSNAMENDAYEVTLTITITAKLQEETAFLIEVQQSGIFSIRGIADEELRRILGIYCPNVLFPYARETIDNVVTKGTFPALMLAQVNFEGLYAQALQQAQQQAAAQAES